ncbi:NAD(P)/FAD-dependent oxidoreductase [Enterocloster hominis (ex Hitch et al. 2024)]|uniref:NAD(P)/FAD-dependent oxidoreductase n=1 Tax=Enterocloster hominis (ex Hitch et al. 2024) TaxID=1917870 RepID=A0ABV1D3U6_9FIRM
MEWHIAGRGTLKTYDVGIIGGGIVGCAIARELSKYKLDIAVFEAKTDIGAGATRGNGGFIHSGYDPEPGTLKALLNVQGCSMYPQLAEELGFPYRRTGAMVVGFDEKDLDYIKNLYKKGKQNGVPDLEVISGERIFRLEPHADRKIKYALYAPNAAVTEPYLTTIAFMEHAMLNGVDLFRSCEVQGISPGKIFRLNTTKGEYGARYLINAAGIRGDEVSDMAGAESFHLISRHGELIIFDKSYGIQMNMSLFPIPTEVSKGITIGTKISGNPSLGSTSVVMEKGFGENTQEGISQLMNGAVKSAPDIKDCKVIRMFSGERAVMEECPHDFYIRPSTKIKNLIQVVGIQSPGIASAPAIAVYVSDLLKALGMKMEVDENFRPANRLPRRFAELTPEEQEEKIKRNPAFGRMVCRCEMVTEGDILEAIHSPAGANTIGGVKRRTRAGMGRCQGGFCQQRVIELLSRELGLNPWEVLLEEDGSNPLVAALKEGDN